MPALLTGCLLAEVEKHLKKLLNGSLKFSGQLSSQSLASLDLHVVMARRM